ncbi:hypothetical protein ACH5RR_037867 [Cinchona calisaya]|uniref:Uncharacterized protein n=1 Tax=Cinchona calisaya TaxID=153742 RepID=A0ABD2YCY1_9GENT
MSGDPAEICKDALAIVAAWLLSSMYEDYRPAAALVGDDDDQLPPPLISDDEISDDDSLVDVPILSSISGKRAAAEVGGNDQEPPPAPKKLKIVFPKRPAPDGGGDDQEQVQQPVPKKLKIIFPKRPAPDGGGDDQEQVQQPFPKKLEIIFPKKQPPPSKELEASNDDAQVEDQILSSIYENRPVAGGGNVQQPAPEINISSSKRVKRMNLRAEYILILRLMLEYHTQFWVIPSANSDDFHQFVTENGLEDISQQDLKRAILFMEQTYHKTVRNRGRNTHFSDDYLDQRFQLSTLIWGGPPPPPPDQQSNNNQDIKGKAVVADQDLDDEDGDDDDDDFGGDLDFEADDGEQDDAMDIAILRIILDYKMNNYGIIPEADSDDLYRILERVPAMRNIQQDELVDRILLLEERYGIIEFDKITGYFPAFITPSRQEIYNLSGRIWSREDPFVINQNYSSESSVDDVDEHREQDQGGADENREDEGDDLGGVED